MKVCSYRDATDDLPIAIPCEIPKLMDMESMQPRFQAINGSLNQAELRGQL